MPIANGDNWQHRSTAMKCVNCMWFVEKAPTPQPTDPTGPAPSILFTLLGRCRKRAPTLNGWPAVFTSDWCGDHKLDDEKL